MIEKIAHRPSKSLPELDNLPSISGRSELRNGGSYVMMCPWSVARLPKGWEVHAFDGVIEHESSNTVSKYHYFRFPPRRGREKWAFPFTDPVNGRLGTTLNIGQFNNDEVTLFFLMTPENDYHLFAAYSWSGRHNGAWLLEADEYELAAMFRGHPMACYERTSIVDNGMIALLESHSRHDPATQGKVKAFAYAVGLSMMFGIGLPWLAYLVLANGARHKNRLIGRQHAKELITMIYNNLRIYQDVNGPNAVPVSPKM